MCFSIPKQITSMADKTAIMEDGSRVSLGNIQATSGDYILIYGNMAVEKIPEKQALQTRRIMHTIDNQITTGTTQAV